LTQLEVLGHGTDAQCAGLVEVQPAIALDLKKLGNELEVAIRCIAIGGPLKDKIESV
jgi:hypothetical protein